MQDIPNKKMQRNNKRRKKLFQTRLGRSTADGNGEKKPDGTSYLRKYQLAEKSRISLEGGEAHGDWPSHADYTGRPGVN